MLKAFVIISLLGAYPAKLLADDYAAFNLGSARLLVEDVEFLTRQVEYQVEELEILRRKEAVISLSNEEMAELGKSYEAIIDDLEKTVILYDEKIIAADTRADEWKKAAVQCSKDLAAYQVVPFYKRKTFWAMVGFVAGVYAGVQK